MLKLILKGKLQIECVLKKCDDVLKNAWIAYKVNCKGIKNRMELTFILEGFQLRSDIYWTNSWKI